MIRSTLMTALLVGCSAAMLAAQEAKPAETGPKVTFEEHIKPIFREHCLSCHNQEQKKGGLSLDSYSATMAGGSSGEVVLGGDVESSRLFALTSHREQPKMPPMQDKLAAGKLELLQKWIEQGALENNGSKAVIKKKKTSSLMSAPTGKGKPEVVAMPEKLWRQPVLTTARAGTITSVASSPWGPLVAVAGQKQIVLYNSDNSECVGVLPYTEGIPYVLKFSRNGSVLLAGGGRGGHSGSVVLFDVKSGKRLAKIGDELDAVMAADINDAHTLVALGGPLKMVRVFSVETGEKLYEMKKHTDWIYAVEFSPDGVLLATSDRSGGVFVWESEAGQEYLNLRGHNTAVYDVAWRPDANVLATAGEDSTIRLWEMNDGNQIKIWNAHAGGTFCLDYTHDGRLISAGRDKNVRTWTGDGAAIKAFAMSDDAMRCTYSHDGKRVLGGDWSGNVKLWDAESATEVATLAANPPTLSTRLEQAKAELTRVQALAQTAVAEFAAMKKQLEDRNAQIKATTDKIAALEATAQKLEAERVAAAKAVEEAAQDKQDEAKNRLAELTTQTQAATNAIPPAKAELEAHNKEKSTLETQVAQKQPQVTAAEQVAQLAQQRVDQIAAELNAFNQAGTQLANAVEEAKKQVDALTAPLNQAEAERIAAEKATAEKAAAAKALADKIAALMNEHKTLLDTQKQAETAAAEKAKRVAEAKAARERVEEALEQAELNRRVFEEAYPKK
jgi:WD40 repeat protein